MRIGLSRTKLASPRESIPAICVLLALSVATHRQLSYWASNYDLWTHTLAVTDKNFIAEDNLGGALLLMDKPDEAYSHFQAACGNQSAGSDEPLQSWAPIFRSTDM